MSYERLAKLLSHELPTTTLIRLANDRWTEDVERNAALDELRSRGALPTQLELVGVDA